MSGATTTEIDSEVSFAGTLVTMPLEDLLGWLGIGGATGTLVIDGPEFTKKLVLEGGVLTASSSTNPDEFLSYYLVGWDIVSDKELDHLFELQKTHGSLIGKLLVTLGMMSVSELEKLLTLVTEEVVLEAFFWTRGSFRFVEGMLPIYSFHPLRLELEPLVLEGVRRRDELAQLRRMVPSLQHRPRSRTVFDVNKLDLDALTTLTELDGSRSVEEIALARRQSSFAVLEKIAADMSRGLVELLPPLPDSGAGSVISVKALFLQAEENLARGQLLRAWRTMQEMARRFDAAKDIEVLTTVLTREIDAAVKARKVRADDVLAVAITSEELQGLDCSPEETAMLSHVNNQRTVAEIINRLTGDRRFNLLTMLDLMDRGVLARVVR